MDVTNIPPFMIKFSEYGEFATLSRKRSIIYIRIKMRASALFDLQYFLSFLLPVHRSEPLQQHLHILSDLLINMEQLCIFH